MALKDREESEFDGIETVDSYEGRTPRLGLGDFLVEVVTASWRKSKKHEKKYFQVDVKVLQSDTPGQKVGTEACTMIWQAPFKIHLRKIKSLLEAVWPDKEITPKFCDSVVEEDLLAGEKLRIRVFNNAKGYPEAEYLSAASYVS